MKCTRRNCAVKSARMCAGYSLGDVPHEAGLIEPHQPVVYGHFVKRRPLLVAKERVRQPDLVPVILAQPNAGHFAMNRLESQTPVEPRLPQVHAHRVILHSHQSSQQTTHLLRDYTRPSAHLTLPSQQCYYYYRYYALRRISPAS